MAKLTRLKAGNFQSERLKVNELLDACLHAVFPTYEYLLYNLKGLMQKNKIYVSYYNKAFLPYHTRDTQWLSHYFEQICNAYYRSSRFDEKVQMTIKRLPRSYIQKYIQDSANFDALRCQYERNLVSAYVQLALNSEIDDFYMKSINKAAERCDPEYSFLFRKRIMDAMRYLGVDSDNAEIGIEICKGMWQDQVLTQTFANNYHTPETNKLLSPDGILAKEMPKKWKKLVNLSNVLYAQWSTLYNHHYNCEHYEIIKRVGNSRSQLRMTTEEVNNLNAHVQSLGFEYECMLYDAQQSCVKYNQNAKNLEFEIKFSR